MREPIPSHYKLPRPKTDDNLTWDVVAVMWDHTNFYEDEAAYRRFTAPATEGQLTVFACCWYLSEVYNGGHDQFFFNSTGMVWRDALNGFRLVGAGPFAAVLAEAIEQFPNSEPAMETADRETQMESIDKDVFEELDQRLYDLEDAFDICATQYILAHPDQFFTDAINAA